jgi:hypothetical protein
LFPIFQHEPVRDHEVLGVQIRDGSVTQPKQGLVDSRPEDLKDLEDPALAALRVVERGSGVD